MKTLLGLVVSYAQWKLTSIQNDLVVGLKLAAPRQTTGKMARPGG